MQKINYPLIISDFDGTLVRSDGTISASTKETIDQYISAGGAFCLCSGRMYPSILSRAQELGLKGLVSAYQGSVVADIESGKLLQDGYIAPEEAAKICEATEEMHLHTHIYELNDFYVNMDDDALAAYEKICSVKGIVITDEKLSAFVRRKNFKVRKVLAMVEAERKTDIYRVMQERFGKDYYVTYSTANLVEITSRKYSKGTAVRFMADYYGVPIEKTIAIGDSLNDLPMLEAAGLGIAVKNADDALKGAALSFGYTNEEDAVEKIIRQYGFQRREKNE